ncbi:MAG TPA: YchJ family metal-binding protein [Gammaproteobacteria bacterium]|nr:YchJ family metal-binding protein [Gammaproteobacteria bacterium]
MNAMRPCPCGSQQTYAFCCGAFIENGALPPTPEALMRSRFTAYHDLNLNYIANTMKPPASVGFEPSASLQWAKDNKWVKLTVVNATQFGNTGTVEFIAYYQHKNKTKHIREVSEFRCDEGKWFYVDGKHDKT